MNKRFDMRVLPKETILPLARRIIREISSEQESFSSHDVIERLRSTREFHGIYLRLIERYRNSSPSDARLAIRKANATIAAFISKNKSELSIVRLESAPDKNDHGKKTPTRFWKNRREGL